MFCFIFQGNLESTSLSSPPIPSNVNTCCAVPNGSGLIEHERVLGLATEKRNFELLPEQSVSGERDISLCQRLLAAIISEEDCTSGNRELEFDAYGTGFELDGELGSNGVNQLDNFPFSGHSALNGYKVTGKPEHHESEIDLAGIPSTGIDSHFSHSMNSVLSDQELIPGMACSEFQYDKMRIDEKLRLEMESIGLFPEPMVSLFLYQTLY